jgi:hypothetical protein
MRPVTPELARARRILASCHPSDAPIPSVPTLSLVLVLPRERGAA